MSPSKSQFLSFILHSAFVHSELARVVGLTGFEPVTLRLSSACSNQLSYRPKIILDFRFDDFRFKSKTVPCGSRLVELRRVELLTYSLQSYRSTN